jgi:hypothetical protein
MSDALQGPIFVSGAVPDLDLLATYLLTTMPGPPFVSGIVHLVRMQLVEAKNHGDEVARIALPAAHADGLRAWLDKEARRLAEEGHLPMSALLRRLSFER